MNGIDDAIDGLSAREAERLVARLSRRLQRCVIDGSDGAVPARVQTKNPSATFSLLLCPKCIEHHRLPEGRSGEASEASA